MKRFFCFLTATLLATVALATNDPVSTNKEQGLTVLKPRDEARAPSFWEWLWGQFGPSEWAECASEGDPAATILLEEAFSLFEMEEID